MTPKKTKKTIKKAERDALIFRHYIDEGLPRALVAGLAGCSVTTVTNVSRRLAAAAVNRLENSVDDYMIEQAERLDFLYEEIVSEWEKSKMSRKVTKTKTAAIFDKQTGQPISLQAQEKEETIEERDGNINFITEAREILADQRALLGRDIDPAAPGEFPQEGTVSAVFREIVVKMQPRPEPFRPDQVVEVLEVE